MEKLRDNIDSSLDQKDSRARSRKFMVFTLGSEKFAVPLSQVKEVIGLTTITPVPDASPYFKGLINLRGRIISVIDLRLKLNVANAGNPAKRPCIIISEVNDLIMGTIVDDVSEVVGIDSENIEKDLEISRSSSREFVTGAAKFANGPLTLLLDLAKILSSEELNQISDQARTGKECISK